MERFTRKNPDGSYRIPFNTCTSFRMENDRFNGAFFGDFVNKLGILEELQLDAEQVKKLSAPNLEKLKDYIKNL